MTMQNPNLSTVFRPDQDTGRQLRDAFGKFATGVTVITVPSADGPIGIVANSFSSVSLDPALVLWSVERSARRFPYFEAADHYAIHVLSADQKTLCDRVARNAHALQDEGLELNTDGVPLIDHCLARFECRRVAAHAAGDHVIIVGQVQRTSMRDGSALTFYAGDFGTLAQG